MTLLLRIMGQLFLILIGYAAACLVASAFIHAMFLGSAGFDVEEAKWIAAGSIFVSVPIVALFVSYFAFMPAAAAIAIGEISGARDWLFYAIAGALVGAAVVAQFWFGTPPGTDIDAVGATRGPMLYNPYVLFAMVGAGVLGGVAYWAAAGRLAGGWQTGSGRSVPPPGR